jgi:hypothetical protein
MPDNILVELMKRSFALEFLVQGLYTTAFSRASDPVSEAKQWADGVPTSLVHLVPKGVPPHEVDSYAEQLAKTVAEMAARIVQSVELAAQLRRRGSPQKH